VSPTFRLSVGSHLAAIAVGAVAAAAYLTVYSNSPQSLADYISAICAKSFGTAPAADAPYLAENVSAMTRRMAQEIIVTQLQEITAMRLSLGQPLPPSVASLDQIPPAAERFEKSSNAQHLVKEP
jgi:hypothetical protein